MSLPLSLFLFSLLMPSAHSLSFNLRESAVVESRFCSGENKKAICAVGDASYVSGTLQLTAAQLDSSLNFSVGRAYYSELLHLWDRTTGELTNFTTNFSISITRPNKSLDIMADGMAFFLSNSSEVPPDSNGGYMGLTGGKQDGARFFAIEFDSYANKDTYDGWDPDYRHIGIDVNSVRSIKTAMLSPRYVKTDIVGNATVSYDASTKNLSVEFLNGTNIVSLSHTIDLRVILPEWVYVGFSGSTGQAFEFNRVHYWNFESALGRVLPKKNSVVRVGLIAAACLIVVIASLALLCTWHWRNKQRTKTLNSKVGGGAKHHDFQDLVCASGPRQFSYTVLAASTDNFSSDNKLGLGGFGAVYRGIFLNSNLLVAIKRLSRDSKQGTKEYNSEVKIISRLRHRNLVLLVGWCNELSELLLVYEFMANGSLDGHLFNRDRMLSWTVRYNIALGLASAILYLHTEWVQCVLHRDIKCSNIMLDEDFNAKLGDFGLARLIDHGSGMNTTVVAGTLGYMAPECYTTGKSSKESDVYSFGIVLLEIACGRRTIERNEEAEKVQLLDWVWRLYENDRVLQAADKRLEGAFDTAQMERVLLVGLCCANRDLNYRPSIGQAFAALNFDSTAVPYLPKKMPELVYSSCTPIAKVGLPSAQATVGSTSYSAIPCKSAPDYSSIVSSKSATSSTSLLTSTEINVN